MPPRLLVAALPVLTFFVGGCAHENDPEPPPGLSESAEDFARRAFAEMDAADTCPDLEAAWDEYLDPATRAAVRRLVPCARKVLTAEHPVKSVREFHDSTYFNDNYPEALADADDLDQVDLDLPDLDYSKSFTFDAFLGFGWVVVTDGAGRRLFNTDLQLLDECLQVQETCRIAG